MEDLNDKITNDELSAAEWNQVPSEIQNVIEATGQTLTSSDVRQLLKALSTVNDKSGLCAVHADTTASAWVVAPAFGMIPPPTFEGGIRVHFVAPSNSGLTLRVGNLAAKSMSTPAGTTMVTFPGEVFAVGDVVECEYSAALDQWIVLSPATPGTEAEKGVFKKASPSELAEPFSGGGGGNALTALSAYRTPGWKSISARLPDNFAVTEGAGVTTIPGFVVPIDNYDVDVGGVQRFAYTAVVRTLVASGTQDGNFRFYVDSDDGLLSTTSGAGQTLDHASGNMKGSALTASNFDAPSAQALVPDAYASPVINSNYAIIHGIAALSSNIRSLYLRASHDGTGGATVYVQGSSYITIEKLG